MSFDLEVILLHWKLKVDRFKYLIGINKFIVALYIITFVIIWKNSSLRIMFFKFLQLFCNFSFSYVLTFVVIFKKIPIYFQAESSHQPSWASLPALIMMCLHLSSIQHCINAKDWLEISYSEQTFCHLRQLQGHVHCVSTYFLT